MIKHLREQEEIILYDSMLNIPQADQKEALSFLQQEYQRESLNYPYTPPPFNEQAASWAATTLYTAAQLMLNREHQEADLSLLLPDYTNNPDPSELLSADLCLRFLPDILQQLKLIDRDDALISILEQKLITWHFSGVNYILAIEKIDFQHIQDNPCLHQLYADRIILNKKIRLAKHPAFESRIAANLGMYAQELWKEFKTEIL